MKRYFFYFLFFIAITACDNDRWAIDASQIEYGIQLKRFELDLFEASEDGFSTDELLHLKEDYPQLFPLYVEAIMGFGRLSEQQQLEQLNAFTANKDIKTLLEDVKKQYPPESLNEEMKALESGFKRYHYYFPDKALPKIYSMISAFNYNVATDDSLLVIGLDTYLGADYPIYPQTGIPQYKFQQFSREYIVADAMKAWIQTEFDESTGQTLLEQMIFYGKILYLVKAFLPKEEDPILFNYKEEDLEWCRENESPIWFHFIDMDLLYTMESSQIRKYLGDAPFISGFPKGSPGRVGQWVGYRIVESYMEAHQNISLQELMTNKDANRILQESNYKPKR